MTTEEIHEEKKKLEAALLQVIWDSALYKEDHVDIEIGCVKLAPIHSGPKYKIVGLHITAQII